MAKIVITIMDVGADDLVAVGVQSTNPTGEETAATQLTADILMILCDRVPGLAERLMQSKEGTMH